MQRPTFRFGLPILFSFALLLALPSLNSAQELRNVAGTVTVQGTEQPLPGVQVFVRGTRIGTLTDSRGNFSLVVPQDAEILVFTYLGYKTQELSVESRMDVGLEVEALGIEGITVTVLGLRREKASLGYSVQDVQGDRIAEVPEINLVNSLRGTVAVSRWQRGGSVNRAFRILRLLFGRIIGEGPVCGGGLHLAMPPDHVQETEAVEGRLEVDHPKLQQVHEGISKPRVNRHAGLPDWEA